MLANLAALSYKARVEHRSTVDAGSFRDDEVLGDDGAADGGRGVGRTENGAVFQLRGPAHDRLLADGNIDHSRHRTNRRPGADRAAVAPGARRRLLGDAVELFGDLGLAAMSDLQKGKLGGELVEEGCLATAPFVERLHAHAVAKAAPGWASSKPTSSIHAPSPMS